MYRQRQHLFGYTRCTKHYHFLPPFAGYPSIVFPNGSINFSYVSGRADIVGTGTYRLNKIEVKQATTGLVLKNFSSTNLISLPEIV